MKQHPPTTKDQERIKQNVTVILLKINKCMFSISYKIKLRMEMGNVSERQQPDHRADNSV